MKNSKTKVEEFIRVDHAGERGAVKIYEGQLLALNTLVKDENLKKIIEEMKVHEKEHCDFFEKEIKKRNIKPTKFLPLWDLLGVGLGFGSTILGKKAAMLCTASVEEVIDEHYQNQINHLGSEEKELKKKSIEFKKIVKIGRTHLQDATPLSLGQEFSGYHAQLKKCIERIEYALKEILFLAQGGTAVGTGINSKKNFDKKIVKEIAEFSKIKFKPAPNKFAELASKLETVADQLFELRSLTNCSRVTIKEES